MWQLLRDQLEREKLVLLLSGILVLFCCVELAIFLAPGGTRNTDFAFFAIVLLAYNVASMGIWPGSIHGRGYVRVLRALPVKSAEAARALWFGVVTPGLVPGAFACVLAGLPLRGRGEVRMASVLVGCRRWSGDCCRCRRLGLGLAAVVYWLLLATNRLGRWAYLVVIGSAGFLPLAWASPPRGTGLVSVEQAALVCLGAVLAMTSFLLCPRLLAVRHLTGTGTVSRRPARFASPERHDLAAWSPALEHVVRVVVVAVAVAAVAIPTEWMFRLRFDRTIARFESGNILILYAQCFLPLAWLIWWRPAARALGSLPLSRRRLAALPLASATLSSLAGILVVVGVAVATKWLAGGSWLWLLPFCAGMSSLIGSVHVRWGGRPEIWVGLCGGFFLSLFPLSGWVGPSTVFWLGVVGGPTLAALGYLILRRGLVLTGTPYRPVPAHPCW